MRDVESHCKSRKMNVSRGNSNNNYNSSSSSGSLVIQKRWILPLIPLLCMCSLFFLSIGIIIQPHTLGVSASLTENTFASSSQLRLGHGASSAVTAAVSHSLMTPKSLHQSPRMQSEVAVDNIMPQNTMGEQVVGELNAAMDRLESKRYTDHRMLVHEGDMKLVTIQGTLEYVTDQIRNLVSNDGQGYIETQQSFDRGYSHNDYEYESSSTTTTMSLKGMYLTVRIASSQYFETIQKIRAILQNDKVRGQVVYLNTNSRDVTDEFVDAVSRADVIDASRTSLMSLLKQASSLDDVFRLQKEINRLTESYESHKSRANAVEKQAALSKLTITIQEQSLHQTKAGRFLPIDMASLAVGQITLVCSSMGNWLIYVGILLVPIFLLACIIHRAMQQQWTWYRRSCMLMTVAAHNNSNNNNNLSSDKNDSYTDSKQ